MAISNNVVQLPSLHSSFGSSFQQLLTNHIHPVLDTALSEMQDHLSSKCDSAANNNDLSHFNECYLLFKKSKQKIKDSYIDELMVNACAEKDHSITNSELSLMENEELDKKLINQIAAQALIIDEGTQLLINLKNRLPDNANDFFLLTPENLCTSFSIALSSLPLTVDLEERLLLILSHHIREPALSMWDEADQLLESKGYSLSAPISLPPVHNHQSSDATSITTNSSGLVETLTHDILGQVGNQLSSAPLLAPEEPQIIKSTDLAGTLSTIQLQLLERLNSIEDLAASIKDALENRGINQKLSKRHQDLISLVGMLFEFILDDHNLNSEVRKLISLLQIPVLKLALLDQEFLNHRHHPARDLLNEMTAAGMKCAEGSPPDDPVILLIEETVRRIIAESEDNPEIFNESLIKFRLDVTACFTSMKEKEVQNNPMDQDFKSETIVDTVNQEVSIDEMSNDNIQEDDEIEEIILESESSPCNLFSNGQPRDRSPFQPIPGLHIGDWVEFIGISERRLRCQLESIDEYHDRYTFTNRSGMKVAEKNGTTLKKEINKGTAKIIDHTPLFDKALQTVMSKFLNF